jgi:iron complex transport system ATP-binding protein
MIDIRDIRFSYGKNEVLKGISFQSMENTVISILGPNGTGKTTFLKCVCGVHKPSSGEILVDGTDISKLGGRELAKKIAFVPQSAPTSRMSVFDSVLIGRKPYIEWGATKKDIDKVTEIIDALGMSDIALKYTDEISGGEFQKAQIARAIVQEPSVLILDEPTNNLDISNQHRTMHMIMDIVRERGMCTIMTMHDINLAVHYSDRLMFIKDGRILAYGGTEIITEELIREVYGIESDIIYHKGVPLVVPKYSAKYEHAEHHHHDHDHTHEHDIHDHLVVGKDDEWEREGDPFE